MTSLITALKEATVCITQGYRVQPGEVVTVLMDAEHRLEAEALAAAANAAGGDVIVLDISSQVARGLLAPGIPEPPKNVFGAVTSSDVVIIKTNIDFAHRFAHTKAVRTAVDNQAKIASVEEGLGTWGLTVDDILQVQRRTEALVKAFEGADKIKITTAKGTNLTLSIKGRPPLLVTPIREKGVMMGPMPLWGEIAFAAVEDSANGVYVADGVMNIVAPFGLKEPIQVYVKDGRAIDFKGGAEAAHLKRVIEGSDANANVVAEFSIGTGHLEKYGTLSEKGMLGTIHLALGDNHSAYPGGKNVSKSHIDATIRDPTIEVDGRLIIKDGKVVIPY
ncbi:MAG: aminopeptidase [Nitrososphaerales archaeon]